MDQLWAPWRLAYVARPKVPTTTVADECFICSALAGSDDRASLLVRRSELSAVLLNRFPYNNGHLLIAPKGHKASLSELSLEELVDLQVVMREMIGKLEQIMSPQGFNVGLNLGKAAGAGLPGHLHWHIVPRWNGDTNFMPIMTDVKVIVQSLDSLYDLLTNAQIPKGED